MNKKELVLGDLVFVSLFVFLITIFFSSLFFRYGAAREIKQNECSFSCSYNKSKKLLLTDKNVCYCENGLILKENKYKHYVPTGKE